MQFTAYSEEQLKAANQTNTFSPGVYDFEVATAKEKVSKNGNEMIELNLIVYDQNGKSTRIFDYLIGTTPLGINKIRNFCEQTNLLNLYEVGQITELDCVGKCGKVRLIMEKSQNPIYPDRLKVKEYVKHSESTQATSENAIVDDDIPF